MAVFGVYDTAERIDIVINNAGFGISGAIEFTDSAADRKQMDVNFFGMGSYYSYISVYINGAEVFVPGKNAVYFGSDDIQRIVLDGTPLLFLSIDGENGDNYAYVLKYEDGAMMLGSIQSGKTRAFIGLMSLCFDNDFDMTIILTKCSKALVQQTVSRMTSEFDGFRTGNATVGDVVAQDILDIDFRGARNMKKWGKESH